MKLLYFSRNKAHLVLKTDGLKVAREFFLNFQFCSVLFSMEHTTLINQLLYKRKVPFSNVTSYMGNEYLVYTENIYK